MKANQERFQVLEILVVCDGEKKILLNQTSDPAQEVFKYLFEFAKKMNKKAELSASPREAHMSEVKKKAVKKVAKKKVAKKVAKKKAVKKVAKKKAVVA